MSVYREGYEFYLSKCIQYELEPINFHYYVNQLSQEQLTFYNDAASRMKGKD